MLMQNRIFDVFVNYPCKLENFELLDTNLSLVFTTGTDVNLLWDAGRKSLYLVEDAIGEGLLEWEGLAQGQILEARGKEADEDQHEGVV